MTRPVPLMRLIERAADGEQRLSGRLGHAVVIGRRGEPTPEGEPTWILSLVEPDARPAQAFRARRDRRGGGAT